MFFLFWETKQLGLLWDGVLTPLAGLRGWGAGEEAAAVGSCPPLNRQRVWVEGLKPHTWWEAWAEQDSSSSQRAKENTRPLWRTGQGLLEETRALPVPRCPPPERLHGSPGCDLKGAEEAATLARGQTVCGDRERNVDFGRVEKGNMRTPGQKPPGLVEGLPPARQGGAPRLSRCGMGSPGVLGALRNRILYWVPSGRIKQAL